MTDSDGCLVVVVGLLLLAGVMLGVGCAVGVYDERRRCSSSASDAEAPLPDPRKFKPPARRP